MSCSTFKSNCADRNIGNHRALFINMSRLQADIGSHYSGTDCPSLLNDRLRDLGIIDCAAAQDYEGICGRSATGVAISVSNASQS